MPLAIVAAVLGCASPASGARTAAEEPPAPKTPAPAPSGGLYRGVDVSTHDRGFDWSQKWLSFGIAKATERAGFTDPTFARNWREMKKNGLVRGAYHFGRPGGDPIKQADHFLNVVTGNSLEPGDLLVLDLEVADGRSERQVNAWAGRWLDHVWRKTGTKPFLYSSWSFAKENGKDLGGFPLWVAHYGEKKGKVEAPAPWRSWAIHQYAATDHDMNVSKLSPDQLRQLGHRPRPS